MQIPNRFLPCSRRLFVFLVLLVISGCGAPQKKDFVLPALHARASSELQSEYDAAEKKYGELKERLAKNSGDVEALTNLAQLFISEARASGDHHYYYPAATTIVDEALRIQPQDCIALATKASLLMTFHRFRDAYNAIGPAVARNPYNAFASCTMIDAMVELGDYEKAVSHCDMLLTLRPGLPGYARASYLRELFGDLESARQAMRMAVDAGFSGHEDRAWVVYQYANLFMQSGMRDTAEFLYQGILEERPGYAPALMGLSNVHSANGDLDGAVAYAAQAAQSSRDHLPLEQLAALYRVMGQTANADTLCSQVLASFTQHEREGWVIDREYAQFCADHGMHLEDALIRAKNDYSRRPENIDAEQTYAWVLFRSKQGQDALPIIDHAMRTHIQSPVVLFVAGMIHAATGDTTGAAALLRQVTGPHASLPPLYADLARRTLSGIDHHG